MGHKLHGGKMTVPPVTAPLPSRTFQWSAAIWAGLVGALVFLMLEMAMVPLFLGGSPWRPVRGITAIVLGEGVLPPPPPTFAWGVFLTAMAIHIVLSLVFAVALVWVVQRWDTGIAVLAGAIGDWSFMGSTSTASLVFSRGLSCHVGGSRSSRS
jgi:hypothetical protein